MNGERGSENVSCWPVTTDTAQNLMSAFGGTADIVASGTPSASVAKGPYFDWPRELTQKQILLIQVARPVPHRSNLAAVLLLRWHGFSDARVNLGVQNQNIVREPFCLSGPAGFEWRWTSSAKS